MEVAWLRDFLAVVEHESFSGAALARNVTQSALSRRIRSLEDWVGVPLFIRTTRKVVLSAAGEAFRVTADDVLRRLEVGRQAACEQSRALTEKIQFASTNALALTFFPDWLRRTEASYSVLPTIHLMANHMEACEQIMLEGKAHFLLGHHHPSVETALTPKHFMSRCVGYDVLIPVSAPAGDGDPIAPRFALPGSEASPLPYLSYRTESGMGRIVGAVHSNSSRLAWLKPVFSSHLAKLLVEMALEGRGLAWLPESLIQEHIQSGALARAGDRTWDISIEIHLFRARARLPKAAEQFWSSVKAEGSPAVQEAQEA